VEQGTIGMMFEATSWVLNIKLIYHLTLYPGTTQNITYDTAEHLENMRQLSATNLRPREHFSILNVSYYLT
jgi:hypothetical protein